MRRESEEAAELVGFEAADRVPSQSSSTQSLKVLVSVRVLRGACVRACVLACSFQRCVTFPKFFLYLLRWIKRC